MAGQRFFQDEARLGQGAFTRVHQQHGAVHHVEAAFDFAAEIGMSRRIDDIDFDAPVFHGRVFCRDRDAALLFQGHRVHHAVFHRLIGAEDAGLLEHGVEQRGLAVVNMRNDGNISQVFFFHLSVSFPFFRMFLGFR